MSNAYPPAPDPVFGRGAQSTADVAGDQAAQVKDTAASAVTNVGGVTKDEASKVVSEAKSQVRDVLGQARGELSEQASVGQEKAAKGLRSLSDELRGMVDSAGTSGVASDLVQQAASRAGSVAGWLEGRDPGSLLDDVKDFARRKPGTFIAIAAVAGVFAGRLTSSIVATAKDEKAESDLATTPRASVSPSAPPVVPATTPLDQDLAQSYTETPAYTRETDAFGSSGSSWDDSLDVASVRGTGDDR